MKSGEYANESDHFEEKKELLALLLEEEGLNLDKPPIIAPRKGGEVAPLSFAQQRLWLLDKLEAGSAYNIRRALRLTGRINVSALEKGLNEIVGRHEALRTTFRAIDGSPVQVIAEKGAIIMPLIDLSGLTKADSEAEAGRIIAENASRPFNLTEGLLIRVTLLCMSEEEHILLLTMHHIVSDGWSMAILTRELTVLYEAFINDEPSPLPELPIQYADFAHWQREWLQGEVLENQLSYWRKQLAGVPVLQLLTDRPRPAVQTFNGASQNIALSPALTGALSNLSQRQGVTLFMTLLAAFQTLFFRYTGQEDIVVGSPIANRNRVEIEGLIGFFINSLVMRTDLSGNPSFLELLGRTREVALGAYAHQDLPFEKLVEELHPERDMSRPPLFQITFALQNMPAEELQLPGLALSSLEIESIPARFDIEIYLKENLEGLSGMVVYNTDLFDAERIEQMVGHFQTLLEGIVGDPEKCICDLPIIDEAERQQLLVDWNDTAVEYPRDKRIHELFEDQVERTPDAAAVIFGKQRLTYRELNTRANQLAHYLQSQGVVAESRVGIWMDRSLDMMVALLGTLKAGGAYVPLDPNYPQERLAFMLEDAQAPVLLTREKFLEDLPAYAGHVVCMDNDFEVIAGGSEENPISEITSESAAYVIYTSGSTGTPKGVIGLHRGAVNRLSWMWRVYPFKDGEVCCQKTYLSFVDSVWEIFGPLLKGVPTVIIPEEVVKDPHLLVDNLAAAQVSRISLVPSLLGVLLDSFGDLQNRLFDLKIWVSSGEEISVELAQRFGQLMPEAKLINLYGSSEVSADVSCYEVADEMLDRRIPIGRPIDNTSIYILDSHLRPMPIGVPGELYIGGVGLARGYLNQPDLTAERFIASPFGQEEVVFKTGDLGRYLADGNIEYLGRIDHQVKVRGFRIELGEIESQIKGLEAVSNCVVVLREDRAADQRLTAYYVCKDGLSVSGPEVRRQLTAKLPEYMVPQHFVELSSIPLTPNGKVDRQALPKPEADGSLEQSYVAPRSETEKGIADIWQEVLNLNRVGIYDDFFELGGHSLLATQVMSRINRLFNIQLPLRRLFEARSVGALAEYITSEKYHGEENPVSRISREGELSVSFSQERLWFLTKLEPGDTAYHISGGIRLEGRLRVDSLEQSLAEIIHRHEALRTTIEEVDGKPLQVITAEAEFNLPVVDLELPPQAESQARLQQIVAEEACRPFDLSAGPLFRAVLVRLGQQEHVLVLVMHHIITDGWSLGVFRRELESLYSAFCEGCPSPLPDLAVQYADYAAWQRERLQGEVLDSQVKYWREKLGEALPILQLPTDRQRPAMQTHQGARHGFDLPEGLSESIKELSRQQGVTLYMTLLAAFKVLLYRYTGQADFGVGSPIANRTQPELEGLIGFFVNTLVLRTDMSGDPGFIELLSRVRETTLDAFDHQELPFEKLVEVVNPAREMSFSPLFQVMFVLQNMPGAKVQLPGLRLSSVAVDSGSSMFDLTLVMWERDQGLSGSVEYNTDLFDDATIVRMQRHFQTLLEGIVADPEQRISDMPLLTETERHQLLVGWNDTSAKYPQDKCIHELIEEQVERSPDNVAVVFEGDELTYREFNQRANQLAHYLRKFGVGPEVLVGLYMERSLEMIVGIVAILKAGGGYLPLDTNYPRDRLTYLMEDSGAKMLLTKDSMASDLAISGVKIVHVDTDGKDIEEERVTNLANTATPANLAYVIYTSGSTGTPKGVMVEHGSLVNYIVGACALFELKPDDRILQFASISFDTAAEEIYPCLIQGAGLHLRKDMMVSSVPHFLEACSRLDITVLNFPTAFWHQMVSDLAGHNLHLPESVRLVIIGGERVMPEKVTNWQAHIGQKIRLMNGYGPTEATIVATVFDVTNTVIEDGRQEIPIGRPVTNVRTYVLDKALQPVPIGVAGELYIGGAGVARGYLNRPELTAEKFIPDPFSDDKVAQLYKTGDLARYLPDSNIGFLGRIDHQVKIRGYRIELGEIEATLCLHPSVSEAAVVAREDRPGDKRIVAYVIAAAAASVLSTGVLRAFLQEMLPVYMIPSAFVFLDALPLTGTRKVDRRALPAPDLERSRLETKFVAPRTQVEKILAKIWGEVLGLEGVGVHDNFFELGGHSLLATQVISRARDNFEMELPLLRLFKTPTIAGLTELIETIRLTEQGPRSYREKLTSDREEGEI